MEGEFHPASLAVEGKKAIRKQMSPRPLYRWKSFWFGLLTSVFMGWASWDSHNLWSSCVYHTGKTDIAVARWRSRTFLAVEPFVTTADGPLFSRLNPSDFGQTTPDAFVRSSWGDAVVLPDAAVFFPFLLAWAGWLGWRIRRNKRLQAS